MKSNLFFIHVPKTGGSYVQVNLPMINYSKNFGLPTHATFNESKEFIKNMITFAIVRNPYTWLESWYFFEKTRSKIKKRDPRITKFNNFNDFIFDYGFKAFEKKQIDYVREIEKENILRTENLTYHLNNFLNRLNLNITISDKIIRKNELKEHVSWSNEMKNIVYNYYQEDFETFEYKK